jgi:hypothetical protein
MDLRRRRGGFHEPMDDIRITADEVLSRVGNSRLETLDHSLLATLY